MNRNLSRRFSLLGAGALLAFATPALAHRQWLLPSATVMSGDDSWVTVDAAVSNEIFYFDHQPLRLANLVATAPDGTDTKIENASTGRFRSTFDVHLIQKGTYKIASTSDNVMGSYKLNGAETRLPRGLTTATLAAAIPAGATDVRTSESSNRLEVFVTVGAPSNGVFKTSGKGIELVPVTHPNDLVAGESATFQFLLDGKPAANLAVTVIPAGSRYRSALGQIDLKADAAGKVSIKWPQAGMYWLNASVGGRPEGGPPQGGPGARPPAAAPVAAAVPVGPAPRRANYVTTLEVLAP